MRFVVYRYNERVQNDDFFFVLDTEINRKIDAEKLVLDRQKWNRDRTKFHSYKVRNRNLNQDFCKIKNIVNTLYMR